jgi:hypothetical protein
MILDAEIDTFIFEIDLLSLNRGTHRNVLETQNS